MVLPLVSVSGSLRRLSYAWTDFPPATLLFEWEAPIGEFSSPAWLGA